MKQTRAVILPYPGDPFLFQFWFKLFNKVWHSEVDRLYVTMNSSIEKQVVDYIRVLCLRNPKVVFTYIPQQLEHGEVINRTLDLVTEDLVMLSEDDGFIFKKGMVDKCFKLLESGNYDIVGSKRGSCSMEIWDCAKSRWGLCYEGLGDQGPNFWPCFFFTSKKLLLQTDRNFGARAWNLGQVVESLGYDVEVPVVVGDTFVNTSLQLRNIVPEARIHYVPQYHGSPDDLDHYEKRIWLFDGKAPWCHIGSLSSGVGGVLMDNQGRALSRRTVDEPKPEGTALPNHCNSEGEKREWERRVQWWLTFYEERDPNEIKSFAELYYNAIQRLVREYKLSMKNIGRRQKAYKEIMGI